MSALALHAVWSRLVAALGVHAGDLRLREGATDLALSLVEAELGWRLPDDYRAWLRVRWS